VFQLFQFQLGFVVRNNIRSIGSECTIHEFIIIVVSLYQAELKTWSNQFYIPTLQQQINDVLGDNGRCLLLYNFLIFFKYFI